MEEPKKIIEKGKDYNIYEVSLNDYKQQIRIWNTGVTEMKFTDDFARANGYTDIQDLVNKMNDMKEYLNQTFGCIPEWITVDSSTGFIGFIPFNTQTKALMN